MEVVFMEFQERFPIKYFIIISTLLMGCEFSVKENHSLAVLDKSDSGIESINGVVFNNGKKFTGILIEFYPNSSDTFALEGYKHGVEHGMWKKYYPGNRLAEQRMFEEGVKTGILQKWWPNGRSKLLYTFVSGEYHGEGLEWNDSGFLTKKMNYKNGHEDGPQQWWYDNGKIKSNYVIMNGRRFGLLGTKNCINVSDSIY